METNIQTHDLHIANIKTHHFDLYSILVLVWWRFLLTSLISGFKQKNFDVEKALKERFYLYGSTLFQAWVPAHFRILPVSICWVRGPHGVTARPNRVNTLIFFDSSLLHHSLSLIFFPIWFYLFIFYCLCLLCLVDIFCTLSLIFMTNFSIVVTHQS